MRSVDPSSYGAYQRELYATFRAPVISADPLQWESLAKRVMPSTAWNYVAGSAGVWRTKDANIRAFDRYRLRPRMMVDATIRDLSVTLFSDGPRTRAPLKLPGPLIAAPIGVQGIVHKDGEQVTARACEKLAVPMVLSTAATTTIEQAAAANGNGQRWFQLYWPVQGHDDITLSLLSRAKASGYDVLVVTADTMAFGWRPADLNNSAYSPFVFGEGVQIGLSDPAFRRYYARLKAAAPKRSIWASLRELWSLVRRPSSIWTSFKLLWTILTGRTPMALAFLDIVTCAIYRPWEDLSFLREHWSGPIVLKGIQTVEDARLAAEHGMDGIIISNHGGRQVDGAMASLDALVEIAADKHVRESGLTLLFDSGVRTGTDVLKALALGAHAVLIGRPYIYGLALAGQKGVEHVFRCLLAEVDITLGLMGRRSLSELCPADIQTVSGM
ncbi:FMN-dependent alpha-hydroxy acid dehydrogenase [Auriculariales sp. MPI-PUGE-AT-0066]|nr:FMN-dependent alpha-hydroxy acid dehydrogenase [Auriculariales sp. MPI-PUGE-AT-0066]